MGTFESDETDKALRVKMKAERLDRPDWFYKIYNDQGIFVSSKTIQINRPPGTPRNRKR